MLARPSAGESWASVYVFNRPDLDVETLQAGAVAYTQGSESTSTFAFDDYAVERIQTMDDCI